MNEGHKRPLLIVIAGPNGSGKTSVTHLLLQHEWTEGAPYKIWRLDFRKLSK